MSEIVELATGIRAILQPVASPAPVQIGPWPEKLATGEPFPDAAISITPYPVDDNDETGQYTRAVQVRIRGGLGQGVDELYATQDAIWDAIVLPASLRFTTLTVVMAWRQMSAPLGLDAQGRPEIADTYYMRSDRLGRTG